MNRLNQVGLFLVFSLFLVSVVSAYLIENCVDPNTHFYITEPGTYIVAYDQPICTIHVRSDSVTIEGGDYSIHSILVEPQPPDFLINGVNIRNLRFDSIDGYFDTNNLRLENSIVSSVSISGNYSYFFNNTISDFFLVAGTHTTILNNSILTVIGCGGGWGGFCYIADNPFLYGISISNGDATIINNYISGYGISVLGDNNLIANNQIINSGFGIDLNGSNSVISNNKIINSTGRFDHEGAISIQGSSISIYGNSIINTNISPIYVQSSNSINLTNNILSCNPNSLYSCHDFESFNSSFLARDITFNSSQFPTTASFVAVNPINVSIDSADFIPSPGMLSVSKYLTISSSGNLSVNISYSRSLGANESLLRLYKYMGNSTLPNGSILYRWDLVPESGVDINNKIVFANLSRFSTFAPLADVTPPEVIISSPQSNSTLTSTYIGINGTSIDSSLNYTNISIWQGSNLVNSTTTNATRWYVYLSVPGDGVYNITATAYDQIGNSATARVENITVNTGVGGGGGWCGNGFCEPWLGENATNCPNDCGSAPICGNGVCEVGENSTTCPNDCGQSAYCGDGSCNNGENCSTCSQDCGICPTCGNGRCELGETYLSCPQDCTLSSCGDGSCNNGEYCSICPTDCTPCCGDSICNAGENSINCPNDCGQPAYCGDGVCNNGENCSTCSQDCGSCPPSQYCGDGSCNNGETCSSCPQDCGSCPPSGGGGTSCPSGMTRCAGVCVNTYSDPSNCGSCGVRCQDEQICSNGACVCPSGLTLCNGECVNLLYNPDNCGSCGNKCVLGVCVNGQCQLNCPEGYYFLNGQCIPYTICEAGQTPCGSTCCLSTQTCDQNTLTCYPPICPAGKTQCGYNCVVLSSDPSNCGSCGHSCPAGQICNNSKCIGISILETCPQFAPNKCGTTCTDLSKDPSNCGACGNRCKASEKCINGACTLIPSCPLGSFACGNNCCGVSQSCDPNTLTCTPSICQSGQTQCGSVCIDTSSDRFNCGGCGITCDITEQCISGKCVSYTCGNGKCDLTENCSTCPQDCGSCQCSVPTPDLCNGKCTNILSDSSNCGACGQACQTGYFCENGVCKGMINANCTTDSDCSQGNCINNKCQTITCITDSQCLSTQYCNTNLNLCVDGCSSDSVCQSIAGSSYKCQLSTHQCVTCPENTVYQNGACVNDSGTYQPIPYQPSQDNPSSLTSRPTFSSKSSPKVFFQEQKQAALDQLFDVFGTSKTRLLAYDQCLRGSLCSTSDDCCGAPCLDSRCACSTSVCTTTADCCSGYCENGKCTSPKSTSLFFLDSISSAFSRSGCSGLIEECSPDEKTCVSYCNGLNILLIVSSAGLGAYLWSFFANPVIGLAAAFLSIIIGISTYPFVGIISAIFIFTFVYSRSLEKIQI
jgi:hypothetical protein